jgi:glycosyltransferase involved in cell wall biosynthesis
MRILVIHSNYGAFGGGEVYVNSVIELLKSHGHEIFLFSFDNTEIVSTDKMVLKDSFNYGNQNLFSSVLAYFGRFYFSPRVFIKLRKWIMKINPDIIHIHANDKYAVSVLTALAGTKKPVVQTIHAYNVVCMGDSSNISGGKKCQQSHGVSCLINRCLPVQRFFALVPPYWLKWYLTKKEVDIIITPNIQVEERIKKCGFLKTVLIKHFVENNHDPQLIDEMEVGNILCVGRLTKDKGFQYVIYALNKIIKIFPKARLDICGDGPYLNDLKKLVADLNLYNFVKFNGSIPYFDLERYYLRSNVVVFPSTCLEICGLVNLEAMKFARPLIISDQCGVSELFENYERSFIFDVTDISLLAEKIMEIISNKNLANHLGFKARVLYETQFSPEIHYNQLISLYNDLVLIEC